MAVEKNIRIQTFSKEGFLESDRMVKQFPEFYAGPKGVHNGPLRIEFTMVDQDDINGAIEYLKRICGDLPLKVKGDKTTTTRKASGIDTDDQFQDDKKIIVEELLSRNKNNQDNVIKELREMGFVFVTGDFLKFVIPGTYKIKDIHRDQYQWLVRRIKEAKDPKNDKYDPQILIGLKILNKRSDRVLTYLYGELNSKESIPVPKKNPMKASKTNLLKFPTYMKEDERLKFGQEHRLLFNNPERKPSKFYMRWYKDVKVGDELKISEKSIEERFGNE